MKHILALIEQKQKIYSQLPLFEFMQDQSIPAIKRLSFAPCTAPFIMSFSDLCKYVFRQEPTNDPIQKILNQHTYEDDFHWQWFLADLEKLEFNYSLQLNDSLKFLWSETTKGSRFMTHELYKHIIQSQPLHKLIIMEAMEATAETTLSFTRQVTDELKLLTNEEYKYFGGLHLDTEKDHNANSDDVNQFIENIYISEKTRQESFDLIEQVFELFTQWTHDLLAYAKSYPVSQESVMPINQKEIEILKIA
ncbi:MAG: hypothetical protein QNJ18_16085 [Xenococcaceae cyanobacterium MO_167.B52]|nr:hypothetical protein [Xenococcaceae cyanobacterium MO_167.B52]